MTPQDFLVHSQQSGDGRGDLLTLPRKLAQWKWLSFFLHRLAPDQSQSVDTENEEVAIVLLGGKCVVDWGEGQHRIGEREHVFAGLPYALYLRAASRVQLRAETECDDVHNPPTEVDLDEIYYYRMDRPGGYAHQRLYTTGHGRRDLALTVRDGDAVLVRDGYHPVVAGHGYNVYYLIVWQAALGCSRPPRIPTTFGCALHGAKLTRECLWCGHAASDRNW